MSYYMQRGDFYTGGRTGYYQGDPFFGALLGKAASFLIPKVVGMFKGGGATKVLASAGPAIASIGRRVGIAVAKHPVLSAAGAAGTIGVLGGVGATRMSGAGTNALGGRHTRMVGAPGRRGRRMHVTNVKALRRAIRRAHGFEKLARKVMGFSSPHKPKGRAYFKRKARAR